jgi:OPA family glycerol-3-phosphate transporter-like MFS transporter
MILFFIQMGHALLAGTASMDFGGRKAAGTAAGFFDGVQYLAGSIAGFTVAKILQHYKGTGNEWGYWALFPISTCLIGLFISISLWNKKPQKEV